MEIGKQLKNARMHSGLTQENVAEKIHVSRQTISNWENDMGEPPYETLKKICRYFEVSADYLLGLED